MFFVLSLTWEKEKILSPHEESNLRPSDSAFQCSTTEPQRLHRERGRLRSSPFFLCGKLAILLCPICCIIAHVFLTVYKNGFIILFCCCCCFFLSYADECQEPLGIEDPDIIEDEQLTASSAWEDDHDKFGAQRGRLNLNRWPQGWTASVEDRSPWFQVNLKHPFIITRVATQGYGGSVDQWVEKYRVSWKSEEEVWRNYSVPRHVKTSAVLWKNKVIITC